jgi:hypothetical protein
MKRKLQVGTILEVLEYKLARQNGRAQSLKLRPPTLTFRKKNKNKNLKMDYEGQDSFLDARGDKKQPSVTRPVQVKASLKNYSLFHYLKLNGCLKMLISNPH